MSTMLSGELFWWCPSLDDTYNGSTSTIGDLSGNARTGTLTSMESGDWTADTDSGGVRCLLFDGVAEYVNIASATFMSSLSKQTISFWGSRSAATKTINFGRRNGTTYNALQVYSDSKIYWLIGLNKYAYSTYTGTGWHHYCFVFDGTQSTDGTKYKCYVDNVEQSLTFSGSPMPTSTPSSSDACTAALAGGNYSDCRMDDIRAFNRVISADELALLASRRAYQPSSSGTRMMMGAAA